MGGTKFPSPPPPPPKNEKPCPLFLPQDALGQDLFLIGPPGPQRRHPALAFCELLGREVEYVSLSRDTTETDLKQRREIVSGTVKHVDQVSGIELCCVSCISFFKSEVLYTPKYIPVVTECVVLPGLGSIAGSAILSSLYQNVFQHAVITCPYTCSLTPIRLPQDAATYMDGKHTVPGCVRGLLIPECRIGCMLEYTPTLKSITKSSNYPLRFLP